MANKDAKYWEKRFEQILIDNEKLAVDYEKEMAKIYEEVKQSTQKELEAFYQRYSNETGLSLADVRKRLNPKQLKKFKVQQQKYLDEVEKLIDQGADLKAYEKRLKDLSAKAYVSKLQELQNNLNSEIMILNGQQEVKLTQVLNNAYLQGYFKTMYEVQKGIGMGYSFTVPNTDDVKKILATPWNGNQYSKSIWKNKGKLTNWLNTDLARHFASGSSAQQMSDDLSKKLTTNYKDAIRLVRTEVNHISNQSTMDSYENSGVVDQYQILATLDSRTSETCRDMDGKIFNLSEKKVAVNMPPFHVNCRTTTVPYFGDEDFEDVERAARDGNGKYYTVPADMSYREWQDKHGQGAKVDKQGKTIIAEEPTSYEFENLNDEQLKNVLSDMDNEDLATRIAQAYEQEDFEYKLAKEQYEEMDRMLQNWKIPEGVDQDTYNKQFVEKFNNVVNKMNSHSENKKNRVLSLLREGDATFELGDVVEDLSSTAKTLQHDMKGIIHNSLLPKYKINVNLTPTGRAYYKDKTLFLSPKGRAVTPHHELMHALEHANPNLMKKSIRFLEYRTKGEQTELLSKLMNKDTYHANEVAKPDKFFSPYCGKQYKLANGDYYGTEILSMGFEKLLDDGANFYKVDPEYFNFVVNVLKNKI